jgi:predicted RNA-binding Zn-ribbon protein involved in translation (DUF1610 family)
LYGYIDTGGDIVVLPQYKKASDFYHGYAHVQTCDGVWKMLKNTAYQADEAVFANYNAPPSVKTNAEKVDMVLRHICENCGKDEILSVEEGYKQGWDYPPKMGAFGVISPRTCGNCGIDTTLWWELQANKTPFEQLSEKHKKALERILSEPDSIMP